MCSIMHSSTRDIILTHSKGNHVHAFPKGVSLNDNVIVPQEFKLVGTLNGKRTARE